MSETQHIAALEQQVIYWRNQANALNQLLQASRRTGETHKGRTITYSDIVGNTAAARADRAKGGK